MVKDIKDLKKLIALCRATGVDAIEVDGCKMNLGPTPIIYKADKKPTVKQSLQVDDFGQNGLADARITTDTLTDEQLLFYSTSDTVANEQQ